MEQNKTARKFKPIFVILPLVLLIGGYFGIKSLMHSLNYESTDNAQVESNAVPVLSRIGGYADSVLVADYQLVKAGDLLVTIDSREYELAVQQAEADLLQAEADLATAKANLSNISAGESVATANTEVMQTRLDKALNDLQRDEALYADGSITKRQLEDSRSNVTTARKQLVAGNQQIRQVSVQNGTAAAQIQKAMAVIATRKAALEQAKLKLEYTHIYAPASGRIGKKNLAHGQFIQPGQPIFTLVDNEKFWVVANFKETQISKLAIGKKAIIKLDGYPNMPIEGTISSFSEATGAKFSLLPPDNASGNYVKVTQRVPVKIEFDNTPELKKILKAGLSAYVDVAEN